jgi:TusA-related sulfurtransferase
MFNSKSEMKKTQVITEEKISVRKTLLSMNVGEELEFSCTDFPLSRCRVIASMIKKSTKRQFRVRSDQYVTTFCVTRLK